MKNEIQAMPAEYKAMCEARRAKALKAIKSINGHMIGTDGRHYSVVAVVETKIFNTPFHGGELDLATFSQIEICDTEEPLQSNVLKVNGLHEIPRTHFTKEQIAGLESRMAEEAFQRDLPAWEIEQEAAAEEARRDEEGELVSHGKMIRDYNNEIASRQ